MAVLGRLLVSSAERLDLPDFLSIDSFTQGDFKFLMKSFVGSDRPYVLAGFDIINPGAAIGTQNVSVRVADSVVYYPESLAGPYFHGLEEGNTLSAPLVPELRKNSTNYLYLTLSTTEAAKDTRAFWDPDKEGGEGGEFTQDVNTQTALIAEINVSTSSFPEDTVPVAIVEVGPNFITSIQDARDMMFRLGTGGLTPDPLADYNFRELPTPANARQEPNTLMTNALDPNAFQGGDKNILSLKEWMDVVMTKLKELGGTTFWYEDTSTFSLVNIFKDALSSSIKSKGFWQSSDLTAGLLTWTEDILIQSVSDDRDKIIRQSNKTLLDNQTMYIPLTRRADINTGGVSVNWFNGINYVNGTLGSFENLTKGDWIKKSDDPDYRYLRVEEFFAADNLGGGVTSPGNALSIKLSDVYGGISELKRGVYDKGVFLTSDVLVADRDDPALTDAGGDMYWLAMRSDTIMNVADITTTTLSIDITQHDGQTAKCTSAAHGLTDGQRIGISGTTNFNGVFAVEVEDVNTFFITITGGPFADELGQSCFYATVTTQARLTDDGLQLESENHNFDTDQTIGISNTTNYNGSFQVFPTGNTTFTIPVTSAIANETSGLATAVVMFVRTDIGPDRLDQGENKQIGGSTSENIMSFIGMDNSAQTFPAYSVPPDYNTLDGQANYNGEVSDNLTQRVSKLTAMMADKAQDKTIILAPSGYISVNNVANGSARDISFNAAPGETPRLDIILPSSNQNNFLIATGSPVGLEQFEAAYVEIDRNNLTSFPSLLSSTVAPIADVPLEENVIVLAVRLGTDDVWLWDGFQASSGITPIPSYVAQVVSQDRGAKMVGGGTFTFASDDLTFSSDAYIQIPDLTKERNTIPTSESPITLANDDEVAFVAVNRSTGGATNLSVSVADEASVSNTLDTFIIARRIGGAVVLGTGTEKLLDGQSMQLDQTTSDQTLTYTGATDTADSDPNYTSVTSVTQSNSLTAAISELDVASENIRTYTGATDKNDVSPTYSSDIRGVAGEDLESRSGILTDAMGDSQEDRSAYFRSDNPVTWTGTDLIFTTDIVLDIVNTKSGTATSHTILTAGSPITLAANESAYITIDRTTSGNVTAVLSGTTPIPAQTQAGKDVFILARRVDVTSVGYLHLPLHKQVLEPGQTARLGASGAGGGEGNEFVETMKDRLCDSIFEAMTPYVARIDKDSTDLIDPASTGAFDLVVSRFKLTTTGDNLTSANLLDDTFLADSKSINQTELVVQYDPTGSDDGATYEVSRNGGNEWQDITAKMERIDDTFMYRGIHEFDAEATNQSLLDNPDTDTSFDFDDASVQSVSQSMTIASATVLRKFTAKSITVTGSPVGTLILKVVNDTAGLPSTVSTDILWESAPVDLATLSTGDIEFDMELPVGPGDIHFVLETSASYIAEYTSSVGANKIAHFRDDDASGYHTFNGTVWAGASGGLASDVEGIVLDLRIRITSSVDDVLIKEFGVLYEENIGNLAFSTTVDGITRTTFLAVADNFNEFTVPFLVNPDLAVVHLLGSGQSFRYGDFAIQGGSTIVFPVDQFNNSGIERVQTLIFDQNRGGAYDNSDANAALMAENGLGSTNGALDKSAAGVGIKLRRPDGTLREIRINDNDEIEILDT